MRNLRFYRGRNSEVQNLRFAFPTALRCHVIGHAMKQCMIANDPDMTRDDIIDEAIKVFLKYSSCVQ